MVMAVSVICTSTLILSSRHVNDTSPITSCIRTFTLAGVTDEGPGFPAQFLPKAFDRLARAEASRASPGSGLGLALVAAVTAAHDGTVRAENLAPGAKVTLDVPC
jgi:signal transduction histidine kinase